MSTTRRKRGIALESLGEGLTLFFKENPSHLGYFFLGQTRCSSYLAKKARSIIPTSNLCRNIQRPKNQLNLYLSETWISYSKEQTKYPAEGYFRLRVIFDDIQLFLLFVCACDAFITLTFNISSSRKFSKMDIC